ncbi:MAG: endolytic transglycosylase MltG [Clostridia bacterium]|nr:endolytic transglycosylase MltG [Clostridia bacterium]
MKRVISCLIILATVTLMLSSCQRPQDGGIPFITTKNHTTTTANPNIVRVTFPEGFTVLQIAERLEENEVCPADEFITACNTPYDGIDIPNPEDRIILLEGYIFADTYEFYKNSDANTVLKKFITNHNNRITDEMKSRAAELGYTMDEILTLASIIQKECDEDITECANVSAVFHNRLNSPRFSMLQSDVTTFYIKNFMGDYLGGYQKGTELKNQNEKIQKYMNLYSTYYCKGLPAGPICNPSIKAITAALYPAQDSENYYFFTDKDFNYYYFKNYSDFQAKYYELKKAGKWE